MLETRVSPLNFVLRELISLHTLSSSQSLKKFEVLGGLVSGTEESRGKISLDRPNRQWDYPCVDVCCIANTAGLILVPFQLCMASSPNYGLGWPGALRLPRRRSATSVQIPLHVGDTCFYSLLEVTWILQDDYSVC